MTDMMNRLLLPPPPALAPLLRYLHLQLDSAGEIQLPATPWPHIGVLLAGRSQTVIDGLMVATSPRAFVSGPITRPITLRVAPGTRFISALLRVGQLPRLLPLDCWRLSDQVWPLEELIGGDEEAKLCDSLQACAQPQDLADVFGRWLLKLAAERELRQPRALRLPVARLFEQDATTLAADCGLSLRQFERRFLASYGLPLRDARRLLRFVNMLGLLICRPQAGGKLAALAQDCGYFDQAHMARDFRALSGFTPSEMLRRVHGADDAALSLLQYSPAERSLVLGPDNSDVQLLDLLP